MGSPHSTWGNLAYTQMNCLPVIQIACVTGIWGISFVVFLFAGTIAALLSGAGLAWQRRALAITVGFIICGVFVFGKWRLESNPSQSVAVTLIARDVPMSVYLGSEDQALELLREYAGEVRRVTPAGTQAVVLPEKIGRVSESCVGSSGFSLLLQLRLSGARRLSLALFEKCRPAPSILPLVFGRRKIRGELRQASSPPWCRTRKTRRQTSSSR